MRIINDRYDENISKKQIDNILQNPILVGDLTLEGEVVSHEEDLKVISHEKFKEIQDIREQRSSSPSDTRDIPEPVDRAANRFGVEYIVDIIESIDIQCRKCGSDLKKKGTTERRGTTVRKYVCTNDDCGYEGPLLKNPEFDDLHQTLPLRCPYCPGTDVFEVVQRSAGFWEYKYICNNCGESFASNASPDKIRRGMEHPGIRFEWNRETNCSPAENTESEESKESEENSEPEKTEESQNTIADY
ncbi:MAG: recombinase family protein [Halobacteriaceae archaeon]